jgi:hypothetical protein
LNKQISQLKAELDRLRSSENSDQFSDITQRMMFKCGVSRIGPLTSDELHNEIDSAFAAAAPNGTINRQIFFELVNGKKMMELRLRKLISEIQADYWIESKTPFGAEDEESGRDLATKHTAEEALHLRSFLRTSALVIQFCRRIQSKYSHTDIDGSIKAAKALSHLLIRSQEELAKEISTVQNLGEEKRYGKSAATRYNRRRQQSSDLY